MSPCVDLTADSQAPIPVEFALPQRRVPEPQEFIPAPCMFPPANSCKAEAQTFGSARLFEERRTTVLLRNLPEGFSRSSLLYLLDSQGFAGRVNFVYMPVNFGKMVAFNHAFVNLASPSDAQLIHAHFQGFSTWPVPCDKVCEVVWYDKEQGLDALVEKYKNSPVMHESIPDECKPIILIGQVRIPFPPPSENIKPPKSFMKNRR